MLEMLLRADDECLVVNPIALARRGGVESAAPCYDAAYNDAPDINELVETRRGCRCCTVPVELPLPRDDHDRS